MENSECICEWGYREEAGRDEGLEEEGEGKRTMGEDFNARIEEMGMLEDGRRNQRKKKGRDGRRTRK